MKKALIFNPYLDTLGGGEFYTFLIIEFLTKKNYRVEIAWPKKEIFSQIEKRFNLNIGNGVTINPKAWGLLKSKHNLFKKYLFTKNYQLVFYISDGSIPFLFAKRNYLLFQSPFQNVNGQSVFNRLKLKNVYQIFCYSKFVKKFIDKEFKIKARIIPPAINNSFFKLKKIKKENIIISVGRFDQIMNAKKQHILVNVFKQMVDEGLKNWELVLLGGLMLENNYFRKLKKQSQGYPIKIIANADFNVLKDYYQKSKIYWHAAGFGENLNLHPERAEHFGISVVEAMACGCAPIVFKGGGLPEILGNKNQKWLWQTKKKLKAKTKLLINDNNLRQELSRQVKKRAMLFNKKSFISNLSSYL